MGAPCACIGTSMLITRYIDAHLYARILAEPSHGLCCIVRSKQRQRRGGSVWRCERSVRTLGKRKHALSRPGLRHVRAHCAKLSVVLKWHASDGGQRSLEPSQPTVTPAALSAPPARSYTRSDAPVDASASSGESPRSPCSTEQQLDRLHRSLCCGTVRTALVLASALQFGSAIPCTQALTAFALLSHFGSNASRVATAPSRRPATHWRHAR